MLRQYELVERVKEYDPDADEAMLNRAYVYTVQKHGTQKRASGDPYFSHPVEVAGLMTDLKLDQETIVTALLHDTVEDTLATIEDIEANFGPEVARLVDGVTKLSKIEQMPENERAAENLRKFLLAMSEDIRVLLVKLADRLHNMRTLHFIKNAGKAPPHRARDDGYLRPAGRAGGHVRIHARDAAARLRAARARSLCHDHRPAASRFASRMAGRSMPSRWTSSRRWPQAGLDGRGLGAREASLFDLAQDGRTPCQLRADHRHHGVPRDLPTMWPIATARWACCTRPGSSSRAGSRTTSRRPRTTAIARSTPR